MTAAPETAPVTGALPVARRHPVPDGTLTWEPGERHVRGVKNGVTIVDTYRPVYVWEPGEVVPRYAFHRDDIRTDLLRPAAAPETGEHAGAQEFYDLVVEGETVANIAWAYPAEELSDHLAFTWFRQWDRSLDHWYEEEEEIVTHPRDPYKRVDALTSTRHVRVEIDGVLVAETRRPVTLFETRLPIRYYIPREDVRLDLFTPTDHHSTCPYKGTAEYWNYTGAGPDLPPNVLWSYPDPLPAQQNIRGLVAFYNEVVDITVDGVRLERPVTLFNKALKPAS